jgi:pimeloyl-ACP methyl ester carboxylesterase
VTNVSAKIDGIHTVKLNIGYELIGDGGGRPWIVTPGGRFSKEHPGGRELAQALADSGNRVIIWDRPNTGESDVAATSRCPACQTTTSAGCDFRLWCSSAARVTCTTGGRHPKPWPSRCRTLD